MDNALLGLGKKNNKATKLHHDLLINVFKEDCKNFDLFLLGYCVLSINYKVAWYLQEYKRFNFEEDLQSNIESILLDSTGLVVWMLGLFVSIRSLMAYSLMKSKTIKKCAKRLIWYIIVQTVYFAACIGLTTRDVYEGKENIYSDMDSRDILLVFTLLILMLISNIFMTLYFHSQKLGLATEITLFDTSTVNKASAAYVKASRLFDI